MKQHRFEIVRRPNGRFGWVFVIRDEGRRRVRARSTRDYGSPEKAREAIFKMEGATIDPFPVDDPDPIPLPTTSFQIVPGVVPLLVQEFPTEAVRADTSARPVAIAEPKAPPKPKAQAKRQPARKAKPRRGGGRRAS